MHYKPITAIYSKKKREKLFNNIIRRKLNKSSSHFVNNEKEIIYTKSLITFRHFGLSL